MINGSAINAVAINAAGSGGSVAPPIYDPADWIGWSVLVRINDVDIANQLIDKFPVTIIAERNAARIAEFTVQLSGTVDVLSWVGQPVTIAYKTASGSEWRLFTGIIANPELNAADMTLHCSCSDDFQFKADAMTNAALMALAGGYWHNSTFDDSHIGFDYLQDLVSTLPRSVELNEYGVMASNSWSLKPIADYTFGMDLIGENNLMLKMPKRSELTNKIILTFEARYERFYHREEHVVYTFPLNICAAYDMTIMAKQMVIDAIADSDWRMVSANYTAAWSTGVYDCSGSIAYNNAAPDQLINGFDVTAALRWQQSVVDRFVITIATPDSIAAYGEVPANEATSIDYAPRFDKWVDDTTDYSIIPAGFAHDAAGNKFLDDFDNADLTNALNCRIAYEIESKINASHRSARARFTIPIIKNLKLSSTVAVSDSKISTRGVVKSLIYTLDLTGAAMPTIDVELAISCGQSGVEAPIQTWAAPAHPDSSSATYPTISNALPVHIGRQFDSVYWSEDLTGWIVNRVRPELIAGNPPSPLIVYPTEKLVIAFAAIDDALTQNKVDTINATIDVDVAHHPLTVTA